MYNFYLMNYRVDFCHLWCVIIKRVIINFLSVLVSKITKCICFTLEYTLLWSALQLVYQKLKISTEKIPISLIHFLSIKIPLVLESIHITYFSGSINVYAVELFDPFWKKNSINCSSLCHQLVVTKGKILPWLMKC